MTWDRFDLLHLVLLLATLAGLAALALGGEPDGEGRVGDAAADKVLERELDYRARTALLAELFGPVEELRAAGAGQQALLKLDELGRRYPTEAHVAILQGEILHQMGALEEAVDRFVAGVRSNGDYVDERSPLSRRPIITTLVREGLESIGQRARQHPDNTSLAASLRQVYYLQSRLAGGCE